MTHYPSFLLFVASLFLRFGSLSAAECLDSNQRSVDVVTACSVDFGVEACPESCLPTLQAFYDDCALDIGDISMMVVTAAQDPCWDAVFGFYADLRGTDCENHRKVYRSMWPLVCLTACTDECAELVDGVCTVCSGALDAAEASSVETELKVTASCPQAQCDLGDNGGIDMSGSSSSGSGGGGGSSSSGSTVGGGTSTSKAEKGHVGSMYLAVTLSILASSIALLDYF